MKPGCPHCLAHKDSVIKAGSYFRKSDSKHIKRFKCKACKKHFSAAFFSACYHQNKRRLNPIIRNSLCSSMSQRRIAKIYRISRTTVKRKLEFLAKQARLSQENWLKSQSLFSDLQFDDLETFEHTKCKPITVTLMVENKTRKILGFKVARIPAKGLLAKIAKRKYGFRKNESFKLRDELFKELKPKVSAQARFQSDSHPQYGHLVQKHFPQAKHDLFLGVRGAITGQGELKKIKYDPLFSINHTFAMLRYCINRLVRKTWCTTKKLEALEDHIALYVDFHNQVLLK